MGGWKDIGPSVYAVTWWQEGGVVKVGYSSQQRWRRFVLRGGSLLFADTFTDGDRAFATERELLRGLASRWPQAFASGEEAAWCLGGRGDGWLECYRAPEAEARIFLLDMRAGMLKRDADAYADA